MDDINVKKIIDVIDMIRPFLINDGGNIEFIKYENDIVYIQMQGACADCLSVDYTLTEVVENALKEEIPSIKKVVNIK